MKTRILLPGMNADDDFQVDALFEKCYGRKFNVAARNIPVRLLVEEDGKIIMVAIGKLVMEASIASEPTLSKRKKTRALSLLSRRGLEGANIVGVERVQAEESAYPGFSALLERHGWIKTIHYCVMLKGKRR